MFIVCVCCRNIPNVRRFRCVRASAFVLKTKILLKTTTAICANKRTCEAGHAHIHTHTHTCRETVAKQTIESACLVVCLVVWVRAYVLWERAFVVWCNRFVYLTRTLYLCTVVLVFDVGSHIERHDKEIESKECAPKHTKMAVVPCKYGLVATALTNTITSNQMTMDFFKKKNSLKLPTVAQTKILSMKCICLELWHKTFAWQNDSFGSFVEISMNTVNQTDIIDKDWGNKATTFQLFI